MHADNFAAESNVKLRGTGQVKSYAFLTRRHTGPQC